MNWLVLGLFGLIAHVLVTGAEASFVQADREQLARDARGGSATARLATRLLSNEAYLLATTVVGAQLAIIITGLAFAGALGKQAWFALLAVSPVLLVGEAAARLVAHHYPVTGARVLARPIRLIQIVTTPLVVSAARALAILRRWSDPIRNLSRQDLVRLLESDQVGNEIDPEERQLIRRVVELDETTVEECMTPLVEVKAVPEDMPVEDAVATFIDSGFSRVPVYRSRIDNIVGLITHRDLLFQQGHAEQVGELAREVTFVPESKRVAQLLQQMRRDGEHFAVVVDEYGGGVGVITVEDLVEEIVGEIQDERDTDEPRIRRLGEREWRVPARTELEELEEVTGIELPEGDYETVAGYVLAAIGRIPEEGEVIRIQHLLFTVEAASDRAIQLLRIILPKSRRFGS